MDKNQSLLPNGVIGEIYIGGPRVAQGYLPKDNANNSNFITLKDNPAERLFRTGELGLYRNNGVLVFCGRKDNQIKIRGYRIEVEEVEERLKQHHLINDAIVVLIDKVFDDSTISEKSLCAYILLKDRTQSPHNMPQILKKYLATVLPEYMIPNSYKIIDNIATTLNGKIDRNYYKNSQDSSKIISVVKEDEVQKIDLATAEICTILDLEQLDLTSNFFDDGGNSLSAVRLINTLNDKFKIEMPFQVIYKSSSYSDFLSTLKMYLERSTSKVSYVTTSESLYLQDIKHKKTPQYKKLTSLPNVKNILITGATGFVGSNLMSQLYAMYPDANFYPIIRANNTTEASKKLYDALKLTGYEINNWSRIKLITGDLAEDRFGMSQESYVEIADTVDTIVHCAAHVHAFYQYNQLRETNVIGTERMLNFASIGKPKMFHHISTKGIFPNPLVMPDILWKENQNIDFSIEELNGYNQSKWVAEKLVFDAKARGLRANIYRIGRAFCNTVTGFENADDIIFRLINACIITKTAPKIDFNIEMTPVDILCKALLHISKQQSAIDGIFHLVNKNYCTFNSLINEINKYGFKISYIPYKDWVNNLNDTGKNDLIDDSVLILSEVIARVSANDFKKIFTTELDTTNSKKFLLNSKITCDVDNIIYIKSFLNFGR